MGARHLSAVYSQWGSLADRPFRVLAYMALVAKDSTPQPSYWGGRDGLCIALGLEPSASAYRIARRAVRDLEDAGALERTYSGHAGKRSEYRVVVTPGLGDTSVPQPSPPEPTKGGHPSPPEGGHPSPPEGGHLSPQRGTPESAKGDTPVPPRNTEEEVRSENEEEVSSTHSTPDRACEPTTTDEIPPLDAKRIVREFIDQGGVLADLLDDAPDGLSKPQRDQHAAARILRGAS